MKAVVSCLLLLLIGFAGCVQTYERRETYEKRGPSYYRSETVRIVVPPTSQPSPPEQTESRP